MAMKPTIKSTIGIMVASFVLSSLSIGQEAADKSSEVTAQSGKGLEEIMVTARKRVEPLQSSPIASTVISGRDLEQGFKTDLNSLAHAAPNVNISMADYWSNVATVAIRGQVQYDIESSYDPPVGIFVDGVYIARNTANSLDLFDVEAIEILRGPQGTMFGRNTSAGAIQIRTRRPSGEFGVRGSINAGQYGRMNLKAAVDLPIVEDKINAKVAMMSYRTDGFFESTVIPAQATTAGKDLGGQDIFAIKPMVVFTPSDKFDMTLIAEYSKNKSENTPGANDSDENWLICDGNLGGDGQPGYNLCNDYTDPYKVDMKWPGTLDSETLGLTVEMNWHIDAGTVTALVNHRKQDEFADINGDNTSAPFLHLSYDTEHTQSSLELRFASEGWDNWDLVAGVYIFEQEYDVLKDIYQLQFDPGWPAPIQLYSGAGQEHSSSSIFAEADYHVNDKLTLTVGGRYSEEDKDFYAVQAGAYPALGASLGNFSSTWDDFGPKVGVKYQINPDLMTYVTYSRGFKSGGYDGRCESAKSCGNAFDPEEVDSLEFGLKGEFFDNTLRTNFALFMQDVEGLQRTVIVPLDNSGSGNETVTGNAASSQIDGIELELSWLPSEAVRVDYSFGYIDAEYDKFCADLNGATPSETMPTSTCGEVVDYGELGYLVPEDYSDRPMQRTPKTTHALNLTYSIPMDAGTVILNGKFSKAAKLTTDVTGISPRKATELVDASIAFEDGQGRYKLSLYVLNLTDEVYTTGRNLAANFWKARYLNPPRQVGVELSFEL